MKILGLLLLLTVGATIKASPLRAEAYGEEYVDEGGTDTLEQILVPSPATSDDEQLIPNTSNAPPPADYEPASDQVVEEAAASTDEAVQAASTETQDIALTAALETAEKINDVLIGIPHMSAADVGLPGAHQPPKRSYSDMSADELRMLLTAEDRRHAELRKKIQSLIRKVEDAQKQQEKLRKREAQELAAARKREAVRRTAEEKQRGEAQAREEAARQLELQHSRMHESREEAKRRLAESAREETRKMRDDAKKRAEEQEKSKAEAWKEEARKQAQLKREQKRHRSARMKAEL